MHFATRRDSLIHSPVPRPELRSFRRTLVVLTVCSIALAGHARADSAASDFSASSNPSGNWSYGEIPNLSGPFTLFAATSVDSWGLDYWMPASAGYPLVAHNATGTSQNVGASTLIPVNGLTQHPANGTGMSVVRWTCPADGQYSVTATWTGLSGWNYSPPTTTDVHLLQNGASIFDGGINVNGGGNVAAVSASIALVAGDVLDFVVGDGGVSYYNDTTGLDATVLLSATPVVPSTWGGVKSLFR